MAPQSAHKSQLPLLTLHENLTLRPLFSENRPCLKSNWGRGDTLNLRDNKDSNILWTIFNYFKYTYICSQRTCSFNWYWINEIRGTAEFNELFRTLLSSSQSYQKNDTESYQLFFKNAISVFEVKCKLTMIQWAPKKPHLVDFEICAFRSKVRELNLYANKLPGQKSSHNLFKSD